MAALTQAPTTLANIIVRDAVISDIEAVTRIYNHYVRTSITTLQESASTVEAIMNKFDSIRSRRMPYIVAEDTTTGNVCGYAYADDWNERSGYRFTAESSIYLHADYCGRGFGRLFLQRIVDELKTCGKEQVLAKMSILPWQVAEDLPSCRLHMSFGFKPVGRLIRVGWKMDYWIDVILLQLDLDDGED